MSRKLALRKAKVYLGTAEAAKRMGVSLADVRRLAKSEPQGSYKDRNVWYIPEAAVEIWLKQRARAQNKANAPSLQERWSTFRNRPVVFFPLLAVAALTGFLGLFQILSVMSDIGGAVGWWREQDLLHTAFRHAQDGEVLVIIATFEGLQGASPHDEIRDAIQVAAIKAGYSQLRAEIHPRRLSAGDHQAAERLGNAYRASIVVWGSETSVRWRVNYLNLRPECCGPTVISISKTAPTQLDSPDDYREFVTEEMPSWFAFYALYTLAESYRGTGDYAEAYEIAQKAIIAIPTDSSVQGLEAAYFLLGWLNQGMAQNDPDLAVSYYSEAIKLRPDYAQAYYNRGIAFGDLGDDDKAIADFSQAILLDPDYADAYSNRGTAYGNKGDYEQAIADYTEAILRQPDDAWDYYNRGLAYSSEGKWQQAVTDYTKAISLKPDYAESYYYRGTASRNGGNYKQAIVDYTKAIELKPDFAQAYNHRGTIYGELGDWRQATADMDEAILLEPDYAEAYYNRGVVYESMENPEQAIADYTEAILRNPDFAEAYLGRANACQQKRDYDQAISDCSEAIRLQPDYAVAYFARASAYSEKGEFEQAIVDLTKAISLEPGNFASVFNRGQAYAEKGDREHAIVDMRSAIELAPDSEVRRVMEEVLLELESSDGTKP